MAVYESQIPILEVAFVALTDNSSVVRNDTQEPHRYLHHQLLI